MSARTLLPIADRRETIEVARSLLGRRPLRLTAALAAFAGTALLGLVGPWCLGLVVDAARDDAPTSDQLLLASAIAVAGLLGGVLTAVSAAGFASVGEPAVAELREQVVERALHLDLATVEQAGTGDLMSRVGDDIHRVADAMVWMIPFSVSAVMAIGLTVVGMAGLDWRLALAGLATAPLYYASLRWYLPRSAPHYARERIAQGELTESLVAGLHGAPTLWAMRREDEQLGRIRDGSRTARQIIVEVFVVFTRFTSRNNAVECVGMCAVLATGYLLVDAGEATLGQAAAAAFFYHRLFNPIGTLLAVFDDLQSTGASLARLAGIARMPAPEPGPGLRPATAELTIDRVGHAYVAGRPVLSDVTLRVAHGERVAVVGESGAGKSTLGAIAAGAIVAGAGEVRIGGVAVPADLDRRQVALVTQEVHVLDATVRANVDLARPDATDVEVRRALGVVGADRWVGALPDRLDTTIGEHGHPVSPAQAQQLALARVVLMDPPVVVLDEATAEAGSSGARDLETAALAVTEGRTALVIAHRLTQARASDRVIVLDGGRVVEEGTHDELVARDGRYAALWRAWSAQAATPEHQQHPSAPEGEHHV